MLQAADGGMTCDLLAVGAASPVSPWLFSSPLLVLTLLGIAWTLWKHQGQMDAGTQMDIDGLPEISAADAEALPFPVGQPLLEDGLYVTRRININQQKRSQLSELCRSFSLPRSGNIKTLQDRLRDFSNNEDQWDRLNPNARNSHLGPRKPQGTKAPAQKKSTQRREALFNSGDPSGRVSARLPVILSTAVPEMRWNQAQHVADMKWASSIMKMYPYHDKDMRTKMAQERLAAGRATQSDSDPSIQKQLENANSSLSTILHYVKLSPAPNRAQLNPTIAHGSYDPPHPTTSDPMGMTGAPPGPSSDAAPSLVNPSLCSESPSTTSQCRTITLGNSFKLMFTEDDVRSPPAISFANDIPALNRMWDDTTEHWGGDSCLHIKGVPIALVYWKDVYSSKSGSLWKPGQWKGTKNKWFEWKVLVKSWRKGTPEDFWHEYSCNGEPMNYTAILARLGQQRVAEDNAICQRARIEYGENFSAVFFYTKNGKKYMKVRPSSIAKQYRALKGIDSGYVSEEES